MVKTQAKQELAADKVQAQDKILLITIERGKNGRPTGRVTVDDPVATIHYEKADRPHRIGWMVNRSSPLQRGEIIVIYAKDDGTQVPDDGSNGNHRQRIKELDPKGPYLIEWDTHDQAVKPVKSKLTNDDPNGDYGWQYALVLLTPSIPPIYVDPWTIVKKP